MRLSQIRDWLIPTRFVSEDNEDYRRAKLIVYATVFSVLTPFPVALILHLSGNQQMVAPVLLGVLPSAMTIGVLRVSRSTAVAGHYLTSWVFLQTVFDFGHDNGFSMLAIFAIPILSCAMIGERAGVFWTLLSAIWVASIGMQIPPDDALYFGLAWSTLVVVLVIGFALVVLESTRTSARLFAERANNELYTQRERLRAFAEQSFPAMAETEGDRILHASDSIAEVLGYVPAQFASKPLSDYVHPEELPGIVEQMNLVSGQGMRCEVRMRHADGHWLWIEGFAIPYGPGPNRWIFAGRNIEAEKKEREALQQAQRLESVGVLAAGMVHDFNNLLTVIMGFSELMPPGEARDEIMGAADEAAKLTRQLVSFARVDRIDPKAVDANRLINDMQPMLRSILSSAVELDVQADADGLFAKISAGQLHQILLNLCTNAKVAMPDGGRLSVHLSSMQVTASMKEYESLAPGRYAQIVVEDTGTGMDDHTRQHAFDPFFSTNESDRRSGLGLASVYGITVNAGGQVTLESTLGAGTRVTLLLPTTGDAVLEPEVELDFQSVPRPAGNRTIVLVEDDISVRTLLLFALEQAGYNVEAAASGYEALDIAKTLEPDLLITDMVMSGPSGMQTAQRLKSQFPHLRVLYISAYAESYGGEWQAQSDARLLAKPFRSSDLIATVGLMLKQR